MQTSSKLLIGTSIFVLAGILTFKVSRVRVAKAEPAASYIQIQKSQQIGNEKVVTNSPVPSVADTQKQDPQIEAQSELENAVTQLQQKLDQEDAIDQINNPTTSDETRRHYLDLLHKLSGLRIKLINMRLSQMEKKMEGV